MKQIWKIASIVCFSLPVFAADKPDAAPQIPDVQTIVSKANIVAYYQGDDGKAKVKMVITDKQG